LSIAVRSVTLLASRPATADAACRAVTPVDETDADVEADADAGDGDGDGDGEDEAVGEPAAAWIAGRAGLADLAASLIVSRRLGEWISARTTTTAIATTTTTADHNSGARDGRSPPDGPRGGRGGSGEPGEAAGCMGGWYGRGW
jgi:hypothetical protein